MVFHIFSLTIEIKKSERNKRIAYYPLEMKDFMDQNVVDAYTHYYNSINR
ncbi:hypothetical protein [Caldalkalibacillus mannanilyticus]|nr:hypothetical protein [Caldalkalibacillus mannanilyticus]